MLKPMGEKFNKDLYEKIQIGVIQLKNTIAEVNNKTKSPNAKTKQSTGGGTDDTMTDEIFKNNINTEENIKYLWNILEKQHLHDTSTRKEKKIDTKL